MGDSEDGKREVVLLDIYYNQFEEDCACCTRTIVFVTMILWASS